MSVEGVLDQYGLIAARVTPLDGAGTINRVYRVSSSAGEFVLKDYVPAMTAEQLARICEAMALARDGGLPVPRVVHTRDAARFVRQDGRLFLLSEFIEGRTYPGGSMPERAARNLGATHARLLDALRGLGNAPAQVLPGREWERHLQRVLEIARARRDDSAVDEAACLVLEQKLRMFRAWRGPAPEVRACWTHGDFTWRNVLFDDRDEVIAIFDFDNLRPTDRGREVLRCFTLGFPFGSAEALTYFGAYASVAGIGQEEARRYVHVYHYMSTYGTWPADVRYLQPELYQARWDQFIEPRPAAWETGWERLADDLAEIAARCAR